MTRDDAAYQVKRAGELARALIVKRGLRSHDRWTRARIEDLQRRRLRELVEHAVARSPLYRERYGSLPDPARARLDQLPPVTRDELMDSFDRWVTAPRLRLDGLRAHLDRLDGDEYHLGRYRALTTGGSSGKKGIFVFDHREWSVLIALTLRFSDLMGVGPRLGNRIKAASIAAGNPLHVTYRIATSIDVGLSNLLRLDATAPVGELVTALNDFQPEWLHAYPSIAALLADEQHAGRLRIGPRVVSTSSELRTGEMTERIREAWRSEPFDCYGITEVGLFGADCEYHRGIHAFDDLFIFEVVDEEGRAVPDGEVGRKLLVTNLFGRTQPLIRYELSDMVAVSTERCPCGRPFPLMKKVEGRSDDILYLPDGKGRDVAVHPMHFRSPMAKDRDVRQYQVVQRADEIELLVVPATDIDGADLATRLKAAVHESLRSAGADPPPLRLELVSAIERDPETMSKLKLVRSETGRTAG